MFKIEYGNINPFEGIAPTPYVERVVNPIFYANYHGDTESFILRGVITGIKCPEDNEFESLWQKSNQLIENFSKPFERFRISEDLGGSASGVLYSNGYAMVKTIDFEESAYARLLPFSISLDVFKEGTFQSYGIFEPSQQVSFENSENGDVKINKVTRAVGFNTSSSALENAVSFVNGITGLSNVTNPLFISNANLTGAVLISFDKKINRLDGSYEVNEGWVYNHYGNHKPYSLYEKTATIDSGDNGVKITINGQIKGGINSSFDNLRSDFSSIDFFGIAEDIYNANAGGTLYVQPISKQITESSAERTIDFGIVYSDTITEDPYIVDSLNVTYDELENKNCVNTQITIKSIDPCISARWTKVKNYAATFSIMDWTNQQLDDLGYDLILPNAPSSYSSAESEQTGEISLTMGVCERKAVIPPHFDDLTYTISIKPSMPTFVPFQGLDCGGAHTVQKLGGLTRKTLTIQGTGRIASCSTKDQAVASLKTYINGLKLTYLEEDDTFLSQHNIQTGEGDARKNLSFSFSWNENAPTIFSSSYLHSSIT